jgi:hypothetical protein
MPYNPPKQTGSVISYPIPLYANVPIQSNYYKPSKFFISNITLGQTTVVTTSKAHNYVIGQEVRVLIPNTFGTRQLNEQSGYVISIPSSTQVEVNINSSQYNSFTSSTATTQPQIMAIGEVNYGDISLNGLLPIDVPGSFQNISPI